MRNRLIMIRNTIVVVFALCALSNLQGCARTECYTPLGVKDGYILLLNTCDGSTAVSPIPVPPSVDDPIERAPTSGNPKVGV